MSPTLYDRIKSRNYQVTPNQTGSGVDANLFEAPPNRMVNYNQLRPKTNL